ncbi:MAG: hypothetical protein EHM24_08395 [Acidobacteria bacterium]|nr:MAG: hypothetical protein EHM24_08395 [Acidobacteriota bacterium]
MSHARLRINYRVFTVFLVVGFVMLASAAAVVLGGGQARLRASFGDHLGNVADQTAANVDSYVFRRAIETAILAAVPEVRRGAAAASATASGPALTRQQDEEWQRTRKVPAALAGLFTNEASRFLSEVTRNDPTYRELLLADRHGRLVAASAMTSDYNQADEEWFTRTIQGGASGRMQVGGVTWDESAGTWALEISVPVEEAAASGLVGVLKAVVDVREIVATVAAVRLGATGDATLVEDDGAMVLSAARPVARAQFFAADLLRERLQAATREPQGPIHFAASTADGEPRLVGVGLSQLRASYPHLKWIVAVSQAESELFAPVRYQLWSLLAVLGLMAIAVLGLALWFSLRLAAPGPVEDLHLVEHPKVETIDDESV